MHWNDMVCRYLVRNAGFQLAFLLSLFCMLVWKLVPEIALFTSSLGN